MTNAVTEYSEFYGSSVVSCALTVLRRHFPALLFLAILNFALSRGLAWTVDNLAPSLLGHSVAGSGWSYLSIIPIAFVNVLFAGIIAHRAWADVVGEKTTLPQDVETMVPECTTLLGIGAAQFGLILAPAVPFALLFILSNTPVYPGLVALRRLLEFALAIGGLAVLAGAIVTSVAWSAAVPAAIVERLGILAALRRSARLSFGFRAQIFGMLFLLGVCAIIPLLIVLRIAGLPINDAASFSPIAGAIATLCQVVALMVYPVIYAVTYIALLRIELGSGSPPQQMP